jgi:transposase
MAKDGKRRRRQFSKEFKRDAVELVRTTGRPIAQIARELGNWVRQDQARLRQLEAENAKLRMERDLLKRTVAFWVTETSTP